MIKHYGWCLLLDKVSHFTQKYETMISKAEDRDLKILDSVTL